MLTSQARETLRGVETLILDEVHAVAGTKRGSHLALSVERLEANLSTCRCSGSASPRRSGRSTRSAGSCRAGGRSSSSTPARARSSTSRSSSRSTTCASSGRPARSRIRYPADGQEMDVGTERGARSIWPSIYPELLRLVEAHRSTIVFVNNRRLAERLALRLNELADREIARAHHGSLAREQRVLVEEDLKAGRIPCLVATSSLELGIDMGAVDLVIQVESPKSVARGLQRIGRAGPRARPGVEGAHLPEVPRRPARERGRRARDARGRDRRDAHPEEPARRARPADRRDRGRCGDRRRRAARARHARVPVPRALAARSSRTSSTCSPAATRPTSSPSCVRGSSGIAPAARSGRATARADSRSRTQARSPTAACSASFSSTAAAASASSTRRWSTRRGRGRRSCSGPRPGGSRRSRATACSSRLRPVCPARCRSGRARESGGRIELGAKIGAASRELSALPEPEAAERLRADYHLDERAARNLLTFLREQQDATGAVPSDRTIVIERFRDEIGDWRVCILTPFGGRVHAPWAMAIAAKLREAHGIEAQSIWSDDGIALHFPETDAPPPIDDLVVDPAEVEDLVVAELGDTALFGSRFRENASRALLIPRRRPGARTPLWQQRLKAQSLLQVARRYGSFPVVLETFRECLQDVFDLPALRGLLGGLQTRRARHRRDRDADGVAVLRLAALRLHRDLYVRGRHAARGAPGAGAEPRPRPAARAARAGGAPDLLDADAVEEVERRLRGDPAHARRAPRPAASPRRSPSGGVRPEARGAAARRAARGRRADRVRGAADRGRGRRALPRCARRDAAFRPARRLPGGRPRLAAAARPALREGPGAVHDRRCQRALRSRRRRRARLARGRRAARTRRASSRGHRARVVRSRRAPSSAARVARGVAARGRARRAGGARALPAGLARDRPPRFAA